MAVVFEGFSIREYASKMRSIDVGKCWPFSRSGGSDDDDGDEAEEPLLPPITIRKFRWWSHELHLLRSSNESSAIQINNQEETPATRNEEEKSDEEKLEMVCPVCVGFTAATVNAVNAHMDGCLAEASREERRIKGLKPKSRTPKKRSILEIFAVAPQIDNLDEIDFNFKNNEKKKKKKKNKKKKMAIVNKLIKKNMNKRKKKMKKKLFKKDGLIAKKENTNKLKMQTPVNFAKKLKGSLCNKGFAENILDAGTICMNTSGLKCLSTKKKHKVSKTSKLLAKHQKPLLPVRGILKNHTKVICGQNVTICNLQGVSQVNPGSIQHSDRHVRFSDKDDILDPSNKTFSCFKQSVDKLYSDAYAPSSEMEKSSESDKELATMEENRNDDDLFVCTETETGVQPVAEKELLPDIHNQVNIPNFLRPRFHCQEKVKLVSDKSAFLSQVALVDDDLHMFDQVNRTASQNPSYAGIPRLPSALNEVHNHPCVNSHACGNVSRVSNSSVKFNDYFEDHTHGVAAMSSMANTRAFSLPSSSGFALNENANGRVPFMSQSPTENITGHSLHYQPLCHLSPMELMDSLRPFPEWKQRAVAFRPNCMDEEFFGLPLNSQGELIQASSNPQGGISQLKKSSLITGSSSSLPAHTLVLPQSMGVCESVKEKHFIERALPKDQLNLFPVNYVKESPTVHLPARLGVTNSLGIGKADVHWLNSERGSNHSVCRLDSDLNLMNISFNGCRQYDKIQNQNGNGMFRPKRNSDHVLLNTTQPTMRLMGKDVAVGRSSREIQGFEDGKVWTDKEIITEHHPTITALGNSLDNLHFQQELLLHPAQGKLKETQALPLEIQSNQASQNNILMRAPESKFFHPYLNWQANGIFQNGSLTISGNPSTKLHHFAHPPPPRAMYNRATNFEESFISGAETLRVSSQLPVLCTPQNTCQHMDWNPPELKFKQNLPHTMKSSFNFPFLHPDYSEHVQPSWFQSSSTGLLPWLLPGTQQVKTPITPSQTFCDVGSNHHPRTTAANFLSTASVHNSPLVSYPDNPMTSLSHMKSSLGPVSVVNPPLIPALPGIKRTSSINMSYRNRIKVKDRMKSKAFGIKGHNHYQKIKKRSAADCSTKPAKIPRLGMQEDLRAVTGLTRENFSRDLQCYAGALELDSNRDEAGSKETQIDVPKTSPDMDSSKVDSLARSGPVKLSAGVKHILKPSQNIAQDKSRPIHSTIPFAAVTDCASFLESQKKSTKVYRF